MADPVPVPLVNGVRNSLVQLTHFIYGLHAIAVLIGVTSSATVAGGFVFGMPSLIAVFLNYLKRSEVKGTWLESHFRWQIRTFWFTALWLVVYGLLIITIIGIPVPGSSSSSAAGSRCSMSARSASRISCGAAAARCRPSARTRCACNCRCGSGSCHRPPCR